MTVRLECTDVHVQKALTAISACVGAHASVPHYVAEEHQADVAMDLTHISDALQGLAQGHYRGREFCRDDAEAVTTIRTAVADIGLFVPRMGTQLAPVIALAEKMAADPQQRADLGPKVLDALTSAPAKSIER